LDSLLAGQLQLFQPFFTLLVAWRLFRPFLPAKAQEAPVENDINILGLCKGVDYVKLSGGEMAFSREIDGWRRE